MNNDERVKNLLIVEERGKKAAEVLENSEFILTFDTIMDGITADLEEVDTSDDKKLIAVVTRYQEATKFRNRLTSMMADGKRSQTILAKLIDKFKGD
jgi:hypothetical protein